MLQRRPPDTCSSSVGSLALCACSYVLVKRSVSGGRQKCCGLSAWLVGLCALHGCFQGTETWRRSSEAIEPLWASCCCSRSLLWLSDHSGKKVAQQSLLVDGTLPFLLLAGTLLFPLLGSHGLCCKPQQRGSSYGKGSASSSRWGRWNQQESWGSRAYGGQDREFVLRVETGEDDKKRRKRSKREKKRRKSSSSDSSNSSSSSSEEKKKKRV